MNAHAQQSESARNAAPLHNLRVLDLTTFLSGPFATQILGDLGAEVIKVEAPDGDMTRTLPPYFVGSESAYYLSVNRNKRSVVIDLKTDEGKSLVRELVMASDVVVENFRPGVLDRLGLSYASFADAKPSLIWCAISGFGQDGPYRDRPAYDMIVQAMSGGMSLTGETEGHSVRSGIPLGDLSAGMYGVIGLLAALHARSETGKGRMVDVAMLDCQMAMLSYQAAYYLTSGKIPGRQGRGHDSIPTYRAFTCGDGADLVMTANTERMWRALCDVIGMPALIEDARFKTIDARHEHRRELWAIIEDAFRSKSAAEWVDTLLAASIPAAVVNTLDRSLSDPQVLHRNMVIELAGAQGDQLRVTGNPVKFVGEDVFQHRYPPALGADEEAVLEGVLGLPHDRVEALRRAGVIGSRRTIAETSGGRPAGAA